MKQENKVFIKSFLLAGTINVLLSAAFDYANNEKTGIVKSIIRFLSLGLVIGLMSRYRYLKEEKEKNGK